MSKYRISMHPLDVMDSQLELRAMLGFGTLNADEQRYVAEHDAVDITESSSLETCARVVSRLASAHIPQLNAMLKDKGTSQHYSNPVELIREESKRRDNKKIWHTGNVAAAHEHLDRLNKEIVSEETPAQMMKTLLWSLLFGLALLALAIYCTSTGAAVNAVTWMINSTWFKVIFILATLGLSLYFGFFSIGVLIVGGVFVLAWVILELPGLTAFITNGLLFVIAGILLLVAIIYLHSIITYKPLSEEDHQRNQERIAEKEALCQELKEYSDTMIARLDIMKQKFTDNDSAFFKEMQKHLGTEFGIGTVYDLFSFLNKYYRKMKR